MILATILTLSLTIATSSAIPIAQSTTTEYVPLSIPLAQIYTHKPVTILPKYPEQHTISGFQYVAQTFNNCGPAALAMVFDHFGTPVSQEYLADDLRPFNNPEGGFDDKAVFPEELVSEAKKYGYDAVYRPEGNVRMLKQLIANEIPVIMRSWLDDKEDIGHYKIVKGYDNVTNTFMFDDSYIGPDQVLSYEETEKLWKPFNYTYVLIYPKEKSSVVEAILGQNIDEKKAWNNALLRAQNDSNRDADDGYARYNQAIAHYYLGNYQESTTYFETSREKVPERILWYQPEPVFAYKFIKQYDKATELADEILNNGNLAFSELYQIKGDIHRERGDVKQAKEYYSLAELYNKNYLPAREALKTL